MTVSGQPGAPTLQQLIDRSGGAVNLLRSASLGRYVFPGIPPEFTNWRDEIRAWKSEVALLEQSYHMCELHVRGPQAAAFLSKLSVNRIAKFPVLRAKQLVLAGQDGLYLADAIVFHEEEEFYRVVGAPFASDWLEYNASLGEFDVAVARDDSWSVRSGDRSVFRFQVQGRNAPELMRRVAEGGIPGIKFFEIGELRIAGKNVRALRHGMAGEPGFELYGAWDDQQAVRELILREGADLGMRKVGADAYSVTGVESGWMPMPLPAIYHSEAMRPYREWLTTSHLETIGSLGGSFVSDDIRDYYVDPIELGYNSVVDWDRDFLGRAALAERKATQRRVKRTFAWNPDDVMDVLRAALVPGVHPPARYINTPSPMYATFEADAVVAKGKLAGISQWSAYSTNAGSYLSLGLVDIDHAEPGTELTLLWGEPDARRPAVEPHEVREIRVTVQPAPYYEKVIKKSA